MPRSNKKKEELVVDLMEKLSRSKAVYVTNYRGLSVGEISQLRNRLRGVSSGYQVVKNTLTKLALVKVGMPVSEALLEGPTAIGFCYDDLIEPAKVMVNFARENPLFSIKGGLLGGKELTAGEVASLVTLPSREVLLSQVMAGLQAPIVGLRNVLTGPFRNLLYVLQAHIEQLEGSTR